MNIKTYIMEITSDDSAPVFFGVGGFSFSNMRRLNKNLIRERGFYVYVILFGIYFTVEVNYKPEILRLV